MSKDPAFLFYPGDYLRDTQCLSEKVQVAYDRIICEHMRNICISESQLKFFTKRLSDEEIQELKMVLSVIEGGYQITWVAESIMKRRAYSESRRENRHGSAKNICKTHVPHMENENENVIVIKKESEKRFVVPTVADVKGYCQERHNHVDPEEFVDFYESKGWMIGKNKMKDWRATVRRWEKTNTEHMAVERARTAGNGQEQPRMTARETPRNIAKETDEYLKKLRCGQDEGA